MNKNILNKILIEWNNSDFNDSGFLKVTDIKRKIKNPQLIYKLYKPKRIHIFGDGLYEFGDKVYINDEHVKLIGTGVTENIYGPGEYKVYIDEFNEFPDNCGLFSESPDLTSIIIPDSVTSISAKAFWGCSGLTSVTIGNSVTEIGGWAFFYCDALTEVTIPNSVKTIGDEAFYGCESLKTVYVEDIGKFNKIKFVDKYSNPRCYGAKLIEISK